MLCTRIKRCSKFAASSWQLIKWKVCPRRRIQLFSLFDTRERFCNEWRRCRDVTFWQLRNKLSIRRYLEFQLNQTKFCAFMWQWLRATAFIVKMFMFLPASKFFSPPPCSLLSSSKFLWGNPLGKLPVHVRVLWTKQGQGGVLHLKGVLQWSVNTYAAT